MVQGNEFFEALRRTRQQARRIDSPEDATLLAFREVDETFALTEAAAETEQRNGPYYITAGNDLANHSFEVDLASWTEQITATGTTARDITQSKTLFGSLASCKLVMTNSGASGQIVARQQAPVAAPGEVRSFEVWVHVTALVNCSFRLRVDFLPPGGGSSVSQTSVTTEFTRKEVLNQTAPALTTTVQVTVELVSSAAGASGTAYADIVRAEKSATLRDRANRGIIGECKVSA